MILIVLQEWERGHGVPPVIPNEQLGQKVPDLHNDTGGLEGQDVGDREDQGTVAERPSAVTPKRTPDDDQLGERAQRHIQSRRPGGECWLPDNVLSIDHRQLQREPGETRRLKLALFTLVPHQGPKTGSALSRLF